MNIKVNTTPEQRRWIEAQVQNYQNALKHIEERRNKEIAETQRRLTEYLEFWESNEIPIYDYAASKKQGGPGFYEVQRIWHENPNLININTLHLKDGWVCEYCRCDTVTKYVSCGDSRYDETYYVCDCDGAKANGRAWDELN